MKRLLLLILAACFTSAVVQAELVIDDFTLPALDGALEDDIAGTRSIIYDGTAVPTVDGVRGAMFSGGNGGGSRIDIIYTFTTAFDMTALGGARKHCSLICLTPSLATGVSRHYSRTQRQPKSTLARF